MKWTRITMVKCRRKNSSRWDGDYFNNKILNQIYNPGVYEPEEVLHHAHIKNNRCFCVFWMTDSLRVNYSIISTEHAILCHIAISTSLSSSKNQSEINIYEFFTFQKSIQSWGHLIQVLEVIISILILCFASDGGSRLLYSLLTINCQCDKSLLSDLNRSCICVNMLFILPVRCPVSEKYINCIWLSTM